eukprot:TRINITY_DN17096_c0_g1_i1.p1 TRINITY_DN17096_c0_g1~~TRINITY_DN17096_c0_g1_i1.p1  ORF type:complete len:1151 (-),score=279.83 TRINITY_DN17096_c0_g1_i1:406-3858(-)
MAEQRNGDAKAGTSGGSKGVEIDVKIFCARLKLLYATWHDNAEAWGDCTAFALSSHPTSEDLRYLKSSAVQLWLLNYEFPEIVMLFTQSKDGSGKFCHVVGSVKKTGLLEEVRKACKDETGVEMILHPKQKSEDGGAQMEKLVEAIRKSAGGDTPVVGVLVKEQPEGAFMEKWEEVLSAAGVQKVDVSNGLSELFAVKDEGETTNIKKAAFLSASALKTFVVPTVETVIDDEQQMSHATLMEKTEEVISEPMKIKVKLKADNCDICYPPVFQSGGQYDLKASAASNDDYLFYNEMGVIICALGARYSSYCSNVARTYLIDPSAIQEKAYKVLLKAQEATIAALKPGVPLSAAYAAAVEVVEKEGPEFLPHLTRNAGAGIGIELRESAFLLNAKNERLIKVGMAFNVVLGLQGMKNPAAKDKRAEDFALLLADTVIVRPDKPDVCTSLAPKAFHVVGYSFQDENEEKSEERGKEESGDVKEEPDIPGEVHKATLRSETQETTKEAIRRRNQADLAQQKLEETARRLKDGGLGTDGGDGPKRTTGELVAYKHVDDVPASTRELMILVDQKSEAVLLPIYGLSVPFHISTIKNATSSQDGDHSYIRIVFNVPGQGYTPTDLPVLKFPDSVYLKELSFRSSDVRHSNQVVQQIKTMGRQVKQRESERAERATLVTQERLVPVKGRALRLGELWIRPNFGGRGRKLTGTLEAHFNGFRYQTMKQEERVDVMYRNIKHAFFQPAENEMITLIHLHLHNPIMVAQKKTKDVQFYAEVVEANQSVGGNRSRGYDPDEIEEEQRERARRNRINSDFQMFCKRVQDQWEKDFKDLDIEFDVPFRDLGFHGVPHKSSAFIVPTVNCLVELIETPFVVITLNDVEIVSLERIGLGQKTFDMRIIFKDFKREVMSIDAVPSTSLDAIKEWLNSMNIKYYESRLNLQWKPILSSILSDPESFVETGGWEFLNVEGTDSDADQSEEEDAYEPSDAEEASDESDDDSSDDESVVNSEDEEAEDEEEEEEEEGKTWDELEEEAKKEDRDMEEDSDSEAERRQRKSKGGGSAAPPRRPMANGRPPAGGPMGRPNGASAGSRPGAGAPSARPSGTTPARPGGAGPARPGAPGGRSGPPPPSRNGASMQKRPPPPSSSRPPPPGAKRPRM